MEEMIHAFIALYGVKFGSAIAICMQHNYNYTYHLQKSEVRIQFSVH